jgi:hypothetical protein
MSAPPRRKAREDWTPAEHAEHMRTGAEPVSDEFTAYVRDALAAADLDVADVAPDFADVALEDMTVEDHFQRLRRY